MRNTYYILLKEPKGKRQVGRSRDRWENIIKKDLKYIVQCGVKWIRLAKGRTKCRAVVNAGNEHQICVEDGEYTE
jgi:hypothetical protein